MKRTFSGFFVAKIKILIPSAFKAQVGENRGAQIRANPWKVYKASGVGWASSQLAGTICSVSTWFVWSYWFMWDTYTIRYRSLSTPVSLGSLTCQWPFLVSNEWHIRIALKIDSSRQKRRETFLDSGLEDKDWFWILPHREEWCGLR